MKTVERFHAYIDKVFPKYSGLRTAKISMAVLDDVIQAIKVMRMC